MTKNGQSNNLLIKNEIVLFQDFNNKVNLSCSNSEKTKIQNNLSIIDNKINRDKVFINQSKKLFTKLNKLEKKVWLEKKDVILKDQLLNKLNLLTDSEILSDETFLREIDNAKISNQLLVADFNIYKTNLKEAINEKIDNYQKLIYLLSQSNFYIKRIQLILYENQFSWLITFAVCLLFLLPIYVKYKVREKTGFYDQKIEIEKRIVLEEYSKFKNNYSKLLQQNISKYNYKSLEELKVYLSKLSVINKVNFKIIEKHIKAEYKEEIISKYEYWADNPFRTKRIHSIQIIKNEVGLLDFVYNNAEEAPKQ
jgi:hypothetical protein